MIMSLNISHIEKLCRSELGVAEVKDQEFIENVHIETSVDKFIKEKINHNSIIFLTGNPGDGKTHLIKKLESEVSTKVEIIYEAGEVQKEDLKKRINECYKKKRPAIIAINTGILSALLEISKDTSWYGPTYDQLFKPFVYTDDQNDIINNQVFVIDLNFRNNLSKDIVKETLTKIIAVAKKPCKDCPGNCAPMKNIQRLEKNEIQNQISSLLDSVSNSGQHATFRDLNAFISFLIFGNTSCKSQKIQRRVREHYYFENAFKKSLRFENPGISEELNKQYIMAPTIEDFPLLLGAKIPVIPDNFLKSIELFSPYENKLSNCNF